MVIDKKRHTSIDNFLSIVDYFDLSDDVIQYIVVLILQATCRKNRTKTHFESILKSLAIQRNPQTISNEINSDIQYDILQLAILNALQMNHPIIDLNILQNILGGPDLISISKIKSSVDHLIKNKLISIDKSGKLSPIRKIFLMIHQPGTTMARKD